MKVSKYADYLEKTLPSSVFVSHYNEDSLTLFIPYKSLVNTILFLNKNSLAQFKMLVEITAVDWLGNHNNKILVNGIGDLYEDVRARRMLNLDSRFCLVYNLVSPNHNFRIILKTFVDLNEPVESISFLYKGANWYEREAWDMFGIVFLNHPDLRRLITDYGFEGHPLRKDFPLSGYTEVRYDEVEKKIVTDSAEFPQEFRHFDYTSPWVR